MKLASIVILVAACGSPKHAAPPAPPPPAPPPFAVSVTGHGPPMILIPGLASGGAVWDGTVAHEKAHYTCHVLTLPGFAGQPAIAAPMLASVREALAAYIRDAKLDHPVIVGHSLGGFVALDLAATHPELAGPLVIVDSLPFLPAANNPAATPEQGRAMAETFKTAVVPQSRETFEKQERAILATMISDPANQAIALDWAVRSDRAAVADALIEIMSRDIRGELDRIASPTLVIATWKGWPAWTHDKAVATYREQYAKLRGADIVVDDASLHFVMYDDPTFLFEHVDGFLKR